jgi:hypothetical protein
MRTIIDKFKYFIKIKLLSLKYYFKYFIKQIIIIKLLLTNLNILLAKLLTSNYYEDYY